MKSSINNMRVIGYYRPVPWSRIGCTRDGRGAVEREIRAACTSSNIRVLRFAVETDAKTTRSFEDRLQGREVMQFIRGGVACSIVVSRLEHAFGSAKEAILTLERWAEEGIGFYCLSITDGTLSLQNPPRNTHPTPHRILLPVHELASLQRLTDLERTQERLRGRQARGGWTGRVPFGFTLLDGRLIEDPDRIDRIIQMKSAHRKGASYRQIAQAHHISVGTVHRLVKTDLRKLRAVGKKPSSK